MFRSASSHDGQQGDLRPEAAAALLAAALETVHPDAASDAGSDDGTDSVDFLLGRLVDVEPTDLQADVAPELVSRLLEAPALRQALADSIAADANDAELSPHVRAAALAAFDECVEEELIDDETLDAALLLDVQAAEQDVAELGLTDGVRTAALAAFARSTEAPEASNVLSLDEARERHVRDEPLRARRMQPVLGRRGWGAIAAALLVFLTAGLLLRDDEVAEAGIQLSSLARVDRGGAMRLSQVQPRYFAEMGRLFTPAEDELLAFGFGPASRLIVGNGDAVRVIDGEDAARVHPAAADVSALMKLETGEVLLVTENQPLRLLVDGAGLLVLEDGAAHVAIDAEGGPAIALPPNGVARFYAKDGRVVPLAGPAIGLLTEAGPRGFGADARSLFDELKFFGGPLPRDVLETPISARTCGVRAGHVRKGRHDLQILPPKTAGAREAVARLTWQPRPWLADAHAVRIHVRAPVGATVSLPGLEALPAGKREATITAAPAADGARDEPGTALVELALPAGWYPHLAGAPLVIEVRVPVAKNTTTTDRTGASAQPVAWFDGLTLLLGTGKTGTGEKEAGSHE